MDVDQSDTAATDEEHDERHPQPRPFLEREQKRLRRVKCVVDIVDAWRAISEVSQPALYNSGLRQGFGPLSGYFFRPSRP